MATAPSPAPSVAPVPGQRPIPIWLSAGQAFKIGFFGIMGAWVASVIPIILLVVIFGSCAAALHSVTPTP